MALQLGALREALIDAGASPETASRAAEELAGHEREFTGLRGDLSMGLSSVDLEIAKVRGEMNNAFARVDQEFTRVHGEINLLRWMAGANFALTLAVFVKLFLH